MADAQGIRRRVGKGDIAYAGISPLPSSSRSAGPDAANATEEPDGNDEYGYAGSEHSADERLATESAEGSQNGEEFGEGENDELLQRDLGEGEDDGEGDYTEGSSADEDSDNDGARPLPSFPDHPPEDDTLVLIAGAVGFLLAMVCSALLPIFGIEKDYVMATGMISLLVFIVYANFVPSCKKSTGALSHLAPVEQITPQAVFIVTACIGTMIGGLVGGGLKYMYPQR